MLASNPRPLYNTQTDPQRAMPGLIEPNRALIEPNRATRRQTPTELWQGSGRSKDVEYDGVSSEQGARLHQGSVKALLRLY